MVKTLKKLAALTAAIALVCSFAVCASAAVTVNTTTAYVGETGEKVTVTAIVSADADELAATGAQVTYYATNPAATATDGVVYIDQKPAENGSATFTFTTDAAYLKGTAKVGYTDGTAAVDGTLPGIPVKLGSKVVTTLPYATLNGTHTVHYTPATGKEVTGVEASEGTATFVDADATSFTFTLADATEAVEITVVETAVVVDNSVVTGINAGGLIAGADSNDAVEEGTLSDDHKAEEGNRKLTVIGKVTGEATGAEYGIIVDTTIDDAITDASALDDMKAYKALDKNDAGYFAVQLIDSSENEGSTFIKAGTEYQTAIYVKTGNKLKIVKVKPVTISAE